MFFSSEALEVAPKNPVSASGSAKENTEKNNDISWRLRPRRTAIELFNSINAQNVPLDSGGFKPYRYY